MASHRITIEPYDPAWADAFQHARIEIVRALGPVALRIEHHGSTAVPGLAAKPVIDIQVSVRDLSPMSAYIAPLASLGYAHVPHDDDARCPFLYRQADPPRLAYRCHVHVVESG